MALLTPGQLDDLLKVIDKTASDHHVSSEPCEDCGMHYLCLTCWDRTKLFQDHGSEHAVEKVREALVKHLGP